MSYFDFKFLWSSPEAAEPLESGEAPLPTQNMMQGHLHQLHEEPHS